MAERPIALFESALTARGCKKVGVHWPCPAHDDRHPSLQVAEARDGSVILKCWSGGCSTEAICSALGLEKKDLFPHKGKLREKKRKIAGESRLRLETYEYTDELGEVLHWNERYEGKQFCQGRWAPNKWRINGLKAGWHVLSKYDKREWWILKDENGREMCDRTVAPPPEFEAVWFDAPRVVLFRLPRIVAARRNGIPVYLVDGEKDVQTLEREGFVATCRPKGRSKWAKAWTAMLVEESASETYEVVIVRDRDSAAAKFAGQRLAIEIALALQAEGIRVRIVEALEGKDGTDHVEAGYSVGELREVEDWWDFEKAGFGDTETDATGASVPSSGSGDDPLNETPVETLGEDAQATASGPSPGPHPVGNETSHHAVAGGFDPGAGGKGARCRWIPRDPLGEWMTFENSETGNAKRFAFWFEDDVRWCVTGQGHGYWLVWDGRRWNGEGKVALLVVELAKRMIAGMALEANHDMFRGSRDALLKHMVNSQTERRINAMLSLAKSEPGMFVPATELDTNRDILVVGNGTLELRTGELRESRRSDNCTRMVFVDYDANARAERWTEFLLTVTGGDESLMLFLWRAVGYSLTGNVGEHCLFFLYGFGRNGKSTFVETINRCLGQYAMTADSATLMVRDVKSQIRSDVARLKEARLVAMEETQKGARVDEGVVKWLTGGTHVIARPLYAPEIEFDPQWHFWICGNHKPDIRGVDDGIWRRIRLIPFTESIPLKKVDKNLGEKLVAEAAGILAWAVEGCKQWYLHGLAEPEGITTAINEYRDEMDTIGHFLREETTVCKGEYIAALEMYDRFKDWAKKTGQYVYSMKVLGMELKQRGVAHKKTNSGLRYVDLRLVDRSLAGQEVTGE